MIRCRCRCRTGDDDRCEHSISPENPSARILTNTLVRPFCRFPPRRFEDARMRLLVRRSVRMRVVMRCFFCERRRSYPLVIVEVEVDHHVLRVIDWALSRWTTIATAGAVSRLPTTSDLRPRSTQYSTKPRPLEQRSVGAARPRSGAATAACSSTRMATRGTSPTIRGGSLNKTVRLPSVRSVKRHADAQSGRDRGSADAFFPDRV